MIASVGASGYATIALVVLVVPVIWARMISVFRDERRKGRE